MSLHKLSVGNSGQVVQSVFHLIRECCFDRGLGVIQVPKGNVPAGCHCHMLLVRIGFSLVTLKSFSALLMLCLSLRLYWSPTFQYFCEIPLKGWLFRNSKYKLSEKGKCIEQPFIWWLRNTLCTAHHFHVFGFIQSTARCYFVPLFFFNTLVQKTVCMCQVFVRLWPYRTNRFIIQRRKSSFLITTHYSCFY